MLIQSWSLEFVVIEALNSFSFCSNSQAKLVPVTFSNFAENVQIHWLRRIQSVLNVTRWLQAEYLFSCGTFKKLSNCYPYIQTFPFLDWIPCINALEIFCNQKRFFTVLRFYWIYCNKNMIFLFWLIHWFYKWIIICVLSWRYIRRHNII